MTAYHNGRSVPAYRSSSRMATLEKTWTKRIPLWLVWAAISTVYWGSACPQACADPTEASQRAHKIPDKVVVLTFDDSAKSHFTLVRPLLKRYKFGATFFITEGFDFKTNKRDYMTWEEIATLHQDGFEIGNHTRDHLGINDRSVDRLDEQLAGIEKQCATHGIPKPQTFAWPGNATSLKAFEILEQHGIRYARRGGAPEHPYEEGRGFAFEPGSDHPMLLPSAGDARPAWTLDDFVRAVKQARDGRIAILQFHGAPDTAHSWVSTKRGNFEAYMKYLAIHKYHVLALRDLSKYFGESGPQAPEDPLAVIKRRQQSLKESNISP